VNTVVFSEGYAVGHSTDGAGFLAALRRAGMGRVGRAVVLGTGGAARAVAAALADEGTAVLVMGRNRGAGHRLAADLARDSGPPGTIAFALADPGAIARALPAANLLVNATSVGGWPEAATSPLPRDVRLEPPLSVVDLVYRPRRTVLLARAASAGCTVVEGVEMLIEQGARSFEIWTGRPAPVEAMRAAAYRALEREPAGDGAGATVVAAGSPEGGAP
jgi:shikimate dehydrogenase